MQKHTQIYFEYFGYVPGEFVPCEVCGCKAVDINHIDCKGIGGSKEKDYIQNLMAMCRQGHLKFGDKKQYLEFLIDTHLAFMAYRTVNENNSNRCTT